ncbi:protein mono-ADP-ribosyltransferase TIPARP-like [Bombina bombina]|uniref:protein mono-ADP-ribosyltransferase TIPARP-like n=1 Tax=Bombina bombina TaxID=8345 RepID=UPI00235B2C19|nr:protein mono-ADP-ribosyltransferase TIPARP-like [Bombina bombina]
MPRRSRKNTTVSRNVTGMEPSAEEVALQELESCCRLTVESANKSDLIQTGVQEEETLTVCGDVLGYQIHQKEGIEICSKFLIGKCHLLCQQHHTVFPYSWQLRKTDTLEWSNVDEGAQEVLERLYCDPNRDLVTGVYKGLNCSMNFNTMEVYQSNTLDRIRRLSTSTSKYVPFHTCYKYYYENADDSWLEFDPDFVKKIEEGLEMAHDEIRCSNSLFEYTINLNKMFQENTQTGTKRRIKKRPVFRSSVAITTELGALSNPLKMSSLPCDDLQPPNQTTFRNPYPETWTITNPSSTYEKISLSSKDKEFYHAYFHFHKTMPETQYIIMQMSRIQNYFQWEKYVRKRIYMTKSCTEKEKSCIERHLFHGTDSTTVEAICKQNFDSRVYGKHGTLYGRGCYFAKDADYSHRYTSATNSGEHCMFLAKVLVGRPAVGSPSLRRPPSLNPEDPASPLYDSCVSRINDPDIFVIFDHDQFYPYFLITYQKLQDIVILESL